MRCDIPVAPPDIRFDVVLKKHRRLAQVRGKIDRRGEKVAHGHIDGTGFEETFTFASERMRAVLPNRIRKRRGQVLS
jgi:hypothetical protein